jgi:hypothetical protein
LYIATMSVFPSPVKSPVVNVLRPHSQLPAPLSHIWIPAPNAVPEDGCSQSRVRAPP